MGQEGRVWGSCSPSLTGSPPSLTPHPPSCEPFPGLCATPDVSFFPAGMVSQPSL